MTWLRRKVLSGMCCWNACSASSPFNLALTLPTKLKYSSPHLQIYQMHIAPHVRREAHGRIPRRGWRKTRTRTAGGQHSNKRGSTCLTQPANNQHSSPSRARIHSLPANRGTSSPTATPKPPCSCSSNSPTKPSWPANSNRIQPCSMSPAGRAQ